MPISRSRAIRLIACLFLGLATVLACAQPPGVNLTQQLAFAGLIGSANAPTQCNGVASDTSGNLYILLNEGDGVRLLKSDNTATSILAQTQLGAVGDIGLALALDPAGDVYVAGSTTSASLTGTAGTTFPNRTDASTNSFLAKFDPQLNPRFVTFTGGSRIVASALAVTADAVFVTGYTYATNLPVTPTAIQQSAAYGSSQNGFVERFSPAGSLVYATYLTGAAGNVNPAAIAADASDNAYIVGSTSASGFPTVAALVPSILGENSGFLLKLTPKGDGILFSTFIPGNGIDSIALASTAQNILLSGSVDLGKFPVDTVPMPLIPSTYQVLVRLSLDGSSVLSSTLLASGAQSHLAPGPSDSVWIDGTITSPLLPLTPLADVGFGFAIHVTAQNLIDQTARFGGVPETNPTFASLPIVLTAIAVDPGGNPVLAGGVQPTPSASLLATQTWDLALTAPTAALPSSLGAAIPAATTCAGSLCPGSAAYLAKLNPTANAPTLALSVSALPFVTLRNLGSADATGLQLTANGLTLATNCGPTLYAGADCSLLLSGGGPGTLTAAAANAHTQTLPIPLFATAISADTVAFSPRELDFGIVTATSPPTTQTVTVVNLGLSTQTFTSSLDATANPKSQTVSPFTQTSTDCTPTGTANSYSLAPGVICHIALAFAASANAASDGFLQADWLIGGKDLLLTGYGEVVALSLSSTEIDFGTQFAAGLRSPRYLYISNNSAAATAHSPLALATGSPFTVADACPQVLEPHTVCRIRLDYLAPTAPSTDSLLLSLDERLSALVTGETLPAPNANASSVNPNLTVAPASVAFANSVVVTAISSATRTVAVSNTGASPFALSITLTGDFTQASNCGLTLAAGATCNVVLSFAPTQPGTRNGLLAVAAGNGTAPLYIALTGNAAAILPENNGTLAFPAEPVGQPFLLWYKVSQPFTSLTASVSGPFAVLLVEDIGYGHGEPAFNAFAATATGTCRNCYLGVQFTPTATGTQTGSLTLSSGVAGSPYLLGLTGTGLPTAGLILAPLSQDFGAVPVNSLSGSIDFSAVNASGAAVTFTNPAFTGDFSLGPATTGGAPCSGILADTATCIFAVQFAPSATGPRVGSVAISAGATLVSAALTGFGSPDPGLSIAPFSITFDNVPGLSATRQNVTLRNTGTSPLQIGNPTTVTANFTATTNCGTLAPGATCFLTTVNFIPTTSPVADTLLIPVTRTGGSGAPQSTVYSIAINGNYAIENAAVEVLPRYVDFGPQVTAQQGLTRQFTVVNLTAATVPAEIAIPRQFVLIGAPCTTLAPYGSCTFSVAFLPLTNGDITGTVLAQSVPTSNLEGFGTGSGKLSIAGALQPGSPLNFGSVASGQTASKTVTLTTSGPTPTTVRRVTSQAPFFASTTCGNTMQSGQSCTVTVVYTPVNQIVTGTAPPGSIPDAGSLIVESDAASSPDVIDLAGVASAIAVPSPSDITPLVTFALSQGSLTFPATAVGNASAPQTVVMTNTGTATIHVGALQTTSDFTAQSNCGTLIASATCTLTVAATPQSGGSVFGALEIASDSVTPLEFISLIAGGTPASLTLGPNALDFGGVLVGSNATLPIQISNATSKLAVFGTVAATGDYAVGGTCPSPGGTLTAGGTCTLQIAFTPTQTGSRAGTLSLISSASGLPLTASLTGIGTQSQLQIAPTSLNFGPVNFGASANLSLALTNAGTGPVDNLTLVATSDFAVAISCGATTLAPGASCSVSIAFSPTTAGARTGTVTVASSDPHSPEILPLVGNGVSVGGFLLTVDGSGSSSVSIPSGAPATYRLAVTPQGGFAGTVALTCAPIVPGPYASCSIVAATLTLATGVQTAVVTINTITSTNGNARLVTQIGNLLLCLLLPAMLARRRRGSAQLNLFLCGGLLLTLSACGGGGSSAIRKTPSGSYSYQVSAASVSGPPISRTVDLTLVVQ